MLSESADKSFKIVPRMEVLVILIALASDTREF